MTRTLPAYKTLYSSKQLSREGQYPPEAPRAQRVLIGVDKPGQEYTVWVEFQSAQDNGTRPVLFTADLDEALAAFNQQLQKMAGQGYQGVSQQPELKRGMLPE
jgi:hypothetical protein